MKKYEVNWHFFNMLEDSQKEVVRLQAMWKGIALTLATSTYVNSNDKATLVVGLMCAVVDQLITGFWFVPKENKV